MTQVVAALIWKERKFLICRRPAHKARPLLWEFVGGKVEPGETHEQALMRECREELDIELRVDGLFMDVVHEYPDITVHLFLYNAAIASGTPRMLEHSDMRWILPEEIPQYEFCPADKDILERLREEHPAQAARRILIDADGCPVVDETVALAGRFGAECLILCDTSHQFEKPGAKTLVFSKGADSVDFALVNLVKPGDIVITQDYGLAAMCLARAARPLNQNGMEYTALNIEGLLAERYTSQKMRRAGSRMKGPKKRDAAQDQAFVNALAALLESTN